MLVNIFISCFIYALVCILASIIAVIIGVKLGLFILIKLDEIPNLRRNMKIKELRRKVKKRKLIPKETKDYFDCLFYKFHYGLFPNKNIMKDEKDLDYILSLYLKFFKKHNLPLLENNKDSVNSSDKMVEEKQAIFDTLGPLYNFLFMELNENVYVSFVDKLVKLFQMDLEFHRKNNDYKRRYSEKYLEVAEKYKKIAKENEYV